MKMIKNFIKAYKLILSRSEKRRQKYHLKACVSSQKTSSIFEKEGNSTL
jgi:hypothetical protein